MDREVIVRGVVTSARSSLGAVSSWWFSPLPRARVAILRTALYSFIFVDVLLATSWAAEHAEVPGALYAPLFVGRWLPLPTPGPELVSGMKLTLLICAGVAAAGKWPRLMGFAVFALYFEWMIIAFSYGKVDHDRFAFLVALAVLPTAGAARWTDRGSDEAAGWAIRSIQVSVVLTYFLAAVAKLRFGGFAWLNGATLTRAVLRRGTFIAEPLLQAPWLLRVAQWGIVLFELASPLLLSRSRLGRLMMASAIAFHVVTFATITIIFLPHLACLLAFAPLERIPQAYERRARRAGPQLRERVTAPPIPR